MLVDSLCSMRVFKLFSSSIHHIFGRRGTCTDAYCKVDKGREVYVNHPFGKLDEYNETEDWRHYIEGVNHFFEANEITDPDKRRSIFPVCVAAKTYKLVRSLVA